MDVDTWSRRRGWRSGPGFALTITVYSLNMFGDAMRDLLDPRLRGGQGSYGAAMVKRKRGFLSRLLNPFA